MNLIIQTSKLKACEIFYELCEICGYDKEWVDELWADIVADEEILDEMFYYLENRAIKDSVAVKGYSLSDLYVFQMSKYNLIREIGKNPVECSKERMVLNSFRMLIDMKKTPDIYIKRLEEGKGNDKL